MKRNLTEDRYKSCEIEDWTRDENTWNRINCSEGATGDSKLIFEMVAEVIKISAESNLLIFRERLRPFQITVPINMMTKKNFHKKIL